MNGKAATTLRLPEEEMRIIRAIAGYENRSMADIFSDMAREYIERHKETMELLNIPGFLDEYRQGIKEIRDGGGKDIGDLVG